MGAAAQLFCASFMLLCNLIEGFPLNQVYIFATIQQIIKTCKNTQFKAYNNTANCKEIYREVIGSSTFSKYLNSKFSPSKTA
jgi:hypothetical protein